MTLGHQGNLASRAVVEYVPRDGPRGVFDRVLVPRAIKRALVTTLETLERGSAPASGRGRMPGERLH